MSIRRASRVLAVALAIAVAVIAMPSAHRSIRSRAEALGSSSSDGAPPFEHVRGSASNQQPGGTAPQAGGSVSATLPPGQVVTVSRVLPASNKPVLRTASTSRVVSTSPSTAATRPTTTTTTTVPPPSPSGPTFQDGFASLPLGLGWADGSTHGSWVDQFNGYGTAGIVSDGGNALALIPKASTSPSETHSALVTSAPSFGDLDVTYQYRTVRQLRTGSSPNSWEVGWTLWHLTDYQHFYYVLLKPDGWELGKEDPAYPGSQRFLATGSSPTFAIGSWHQVRVVQIGSSISVWADGSFLVSFVDNERPYLTGSLGLYCEDSETHFLKVVVK